MASLKMAGKTSLQESSETSSLPFHVITDFMKKQLPLQDLICIFSGAGNNNEWCPSKETMKTAILPVYLLFSPFSILSQKCFTLFQTLKQKCFLFFPAVCLPEVFFFLFPRGNLSVYFAVIPAIHFFTHLFFSPLLWKSESCRVPAKKELKESI